MARLTRRTQLLALAALAGVARLPALFASRHLTVDDGVFGASAVAMRHGGIPFREVFSSQGPLFLPLVWLFDLLGLRTANAPRLLGVAAGVVLTLAVFSIGNRLAGPGAGLLAAATTALSGSVLWTTGPLAADGPASALAVSGVALALSFRDRPSPGRAVGTGLLMGAAFAVKSLLVAPAGVAVAWLFLASRRWRDLSLAIVVAATLVLAVALPWDLARVWDQSVVFHLEAADKRTPGANAAKVLSTTWDRDLFPLALAVAGGTAALLPLASRPRRGRSAAPSPSAASELRGRAAPVVVWLVATLLVLVLEHPLWRPHLAHLVAPLALLGSAGLATRARGACSPVRLLAAVLLVLAVLHLVGNRDILWPRRLEGAAAAAAADLRRLPRGSFAISDEPGFVWRAGLRAPDDLVDASILRIESGRITSESLRRAAARPRVCAVLVWSHRFARFDLGSRLDGYRVAARYGNGRVLYVRRGCPLSSNLASRHVRSPQQEAENREGVKAGGAPSGRGPAGAELGR